MAFWAWCVGGVLAVIAVLMTDLPVLSLPFHAAALAALLFFVLCLSAFGTLWLRTKTWQLRLLVVPCIVLGVCVLGVRAWQVKQEFESLIPTPMQVKACVRVLELSDAIGDQGYRQKAQLKDIRVYGRPYRHELTVLLLAKADKDALQVGQEAVMTLRLVPPKEQKTSTFDEARWLATRHIHAYAHVLSIDGVVPIHDLTPSERFLLMVERGRETYRNVFLKNFPQDQAHAVTLSLLTGDRALIDGKTKAIYQYGGISHLLAISGAHVLFLALLLSSVVLFFVDRFGASLYVRLPRWQLSFWVMGLTALIYALFTGFEVPALRTVYMLFCVGLCRYCLSSPQASKVLAASALLMVFFDPYVVWQAGFWLSFVAVLILQSHIQTVPKTNWHERFWGFLKLQVQIFVAMLPISLLFFGKVSLIGLLVNFFAVGLFGAIIVPLDLLAGVLYWIVPSVSWLLWGLCAWLLGFVEKSLFALKLLGEHWLAWDMSVGAVLLFLVAGAVLFGRMLPRRFAVLPLFLAVCGLFFGQRPQGIVVLDVAPKVRATLLGYGDDGWLLLSSAAHARPNDERLAEALFVALKQHKIKRLQLALVQDDSLALAKGIGRLSLMMPVHRLSWAGEPMRVGKLSAIHCEAGQVVALPDGQIKVLTGWRLPQPQLTGCAVAVQTQTQKSTLVIDASSHDKRWQIYRLLCPAPFAAQWQGEQEVPEVLKEFIVEGSQ